MSRWRPSVTVAAVIERGGRFLFVEEIANGQRVLNQPAELATRRAEHRSPLVQKCVDDCLAGRSFPLEVLSKPYA